MVDRAADGYAGSLTREAAEVEDLHQLAGLLRTLRRRHARGRRDRELTYRDLAERTGWSLTSIAEYFTAKRLPPTDRFDALLVLLGADLAEQGALASARDRVDERRRNGHPRLAESGSPQGRVDDGAPTVAKGAVVPRQLPPAVRHFGGRDRELAELARLTGLAGLPDGTRAAGTVLVTAIGGTAGVGKTTLALYWAHQVADRFPDGNLYVNLRGFYPGGRAMDPAVATRHFLDALDVPPSRVPADPDAQTALYRSLLANRRMLIVLDNARDAAQVRPLLPAAPGCLVLITSRNLLSGLIAAEGAHPVMLDLFTVAEARQVLANRLGADRLAVAPDAVDEIVERCGRLPLALAVVAARAAAHPELPLAAVAEELAGARGKLDVFADHDPYTDIRAVFSWSYHALTAPAARLFRLLSLHPGPDVTAPAAASLAAVDLTGARALLTELRRANLAIERRGGRYTCHDLLRAYAADLAGTTDSEPDRDAATDRLIDHYVRAAQAANRLLDPTVEDPPDPPTGAAGPEEFSDSRQALDWFAAEHAVLLNVVDHAARAGRDASVGPLAHAVAPFLDRQGHWHDGLTIWGTVIGSTQRLGDRAAEARAQRHLGRAYTRLYRFDDAVVHLRRALELTDATGDRTERAHVHGMLAILCERRGDLELALHHNREALDGYRATGHRRGEANALNGIGWNLTLLGDHEKALAHCQPALTLLEQEGDRAGQAQTWDSLGHAHHGLGQHAEAAACYRHALELVRELGDRFGEAEGLDRIGDVQRDTGDPATARRSWRRALDILTELGHPSAERIRAKLAAGDDGIART
jgi:tetratricopeptide (TPR) repeat protein/transcriptional regulator with XRE-family HTH domain